jgi:hypothetical protein
MPGPSPPAKDSTRLILGLFVLNHLLIPASSAAGDVSVTLVASGAGSVAQGAPFGFEAIAGNGSSDPVTVEVLFELTSTEGGRAPVAFHRWSVTLPGGGNKGLAMSVVPAQWFEPIGPYEVSALIDGSVAGGPLQFEVTRPTVTVPIFQDVTDEVGLRTKVPAPECIRAGSGAAWGDADGDGDLDLYVPLQWQRAQLWIQDGAGRFGDQAVRRGVDNPGSVGMGATFGDYDNDGDQDLFVVNDGPDRLYRNDGSGSFTDVAALAGVDDPRPGPSASWGDYDNDGYLDLFVTNNGNDCVGREHPDGLYHNEGDGTFTDQTAMLERDGTTIGAGFQGTWFDYDGDADLDLYLANDFLHIDPNHLWRNDGPGPGASWKFTDVSEESGAGWAMASMGTAVADYDRDMDLDFAVSDVGTNLLARNNGDGTFTDVAVDAGVARPRQDADHTSITWGMGFYDLNLDGWEDLYVAAGPTRFGAPSPTQPNEVFVADGSGTAFLDLSAPSHANDRGVSRGVAFADYNRDGLVDLYVVNQWGRPHLLRNVTDSSGLHWLEVDLVGTRSNRDGCGARVVLTTEQGTMLREVFCGSTSVASGSDTVLHFGLGNLSSVSELVVTWPSGQTQVVTDPGLDQLVEVIEPSQGAP